MFNRCSDQILFLKYKPFCLVLFVGTFWFAFVLFYVYFCFCLFVCFYLFAYGWVSVCRDGVCFQVVTIANKAFFLQFAYHHHAMFSTPKVNGFVHAEVTPLAYKACWSCCQWKYRVRIWFKVMRWTKRRQVCKKHIKALKTWFTYSYNEDWCI